MNVSRTLPIGLNLDILNLYGIEAWVQDIDINYMGDQTDDNITLTIKGKTHKLVWPKVAYQILILHIQSHAKDLS